MPATHDDAVGTQGHLVQKHLGLCDEDRQERRSSCNVQGSFRGITKIKRSLQGALTNVYRGTGSALVLAIYDEIQKYL